MSTATIELPIRKPIPRRGDGTLPPVSAGS
jgi:hypothetical protein